MATITIYASTGVSEIVLKQSNRSSSFSIYEGDSHEFKNLNPNAYIEIRDVDALSGYSSPYTDNYGNDLNNGHTYYISGGDQDVYVKATYAQPVTTYTITYRGNVEDGGSTDPQSGATSYIIRDCGFYKNGYSFDYWRTATGTRYDPGDTITPTSNIVLYAKWTLDQTDYTLTYHADDATGGSTPSQTGNYYYTVRECGFYKDGYSFDHWRTFSGKKYDPGDVIVLTTNTHLYAVWIRNITLTLLSKGTLYDTYTVPYKRAVSLPIPADTATERFEYWYSITESGVIVKYDPSSSYAFDQDTTLYAAWKTVHTHTVTLYYGDFIEELTVEEDEWFVLPTPTDTATKRFEYWYREISGSEIEIYDGGDEVLVDEDMEFYAEWTTITYTITYNGNNATSGSTAKQEGSSTYTIRQNGFQRTGYAFQYWTYSDEYDQEHIYRPGDRVTPTRNMTLYAFWLRAYTITYHANGGAGAPSEQTKIHNVDLTLSSTVPTRSGYDFVNWFDGTDYYSPGGTYTANSPASLYAQWRLKTYTVTYNLNGGGGGPTSPDTKTHGVTYTIPSTKPTKTGNTFQHWVDDLENSYAPGASYVRNANTIFSAVWKLNEYDVTYYANGGSGAPEKQKKIYGQDLTLSTVKPTKANSVFLGWAKSSAATTAQYQPGDTYTDNKTLSLWAVWTAKTKFYWHGSNKEDAKYFKVGARIDLAVTASAWNDLCDYINTVRSLAGLSTVAFAKVTAGQDTIKANTFNIVRNAINQIVQKGYGKAAYVPDLVNTGTTITTVMFNGTKGLKNAINKCMDDL